MRPDPRITAVRRVRTAARELLLACVAATPTAAVQLHRAYDGSLAPNDATDKLLLTLIDMRDAARH